MALDDPQLKKLTDLIKDSFRVRKNQPPVYVDIGGNLGRVGAAQHQIIFGRRGSGKSCLLVHYLTSSSPKDLFPIYILADEFKRLTYPDILVRLLIEILNSVPVRWRRLKRLFRRPIPTLACARELRELLDIAEESEIVEDRQRRSSEAASASVRVDPMADARIGSSTDQTYGRTSRFKARKIDSLERHLREYKRSIVDTLQGRPRVRACVLIDDFYLVPREWQPDVLDYLHRLLRDTDVYLKLATIRHRTTLLRNHPQTIGVELAQDVEEINLDRTLEDLEATQQFLTQMIRSLGQRVGIADVTGSDYLNPEAIQALTLASGGVPRDFLNIFVNAIEASLSEQKRQWLTPKYIYRGAGRLAYQTKLRNLREDANGEAAGLERVLADLLTFCLKERRTTAFLVSQEETQQRRREHEFIQQLMDFKLIHVIEPDTSAASGRPGRYEAYTLDVSLFMEPRRRNITIVEFWRRGPDSHRIGVREAPVYPLQRAGAVFDDATRESDTEGLLEQVEEEQVEPEEAERRGTEPPPRLRQASLFDTDVSGSNG